MLWKSAVELHLASFRLNLLNLHFRDREQPFRGETWPHVEIAFSTCYALDIQRDSGDAFASRSSDQSQFERPQR